MLRERNDLLGVLEAAYRLDGDDGTWLARVVDRAARAGLDRGLGVCGMLYDLTDGVRIWEPVTRGTPEGALDALRALEGSTTPELARRFLIATPTCSTMSARLRLGARMLQHPAHQTFLAPLGIVDFLGVAATEPTGSGCLVGAPLPEVTKVPRGEAHAWARVAAHLAAGLRLRRRKAPMAAVLSPTGKVEHAEDSAKGSLEALRDGARAMVDAQRTSDVPSGLEAWRALVDGRFSLVDQFDHDGKRYVVAFRNEPTAPNLHASLTDREAQVLGYLAQGHANKLIGYELGLSPSTVAMHLSNASSKLCAKSRVELVRLARNLSTEKPS